MTDHIDAIAAGIETLGFDIGTSLERRAKASLIEQALMLSGFQIAALPAPSAPPPHSQASEVVELLNASPDDYWSKITTEVERAGSEVRHAHLLNHEAAHLLAWANISRNAALSAQGKA